MFSNSNEENKKTLSKKKQKNFLILFCKKYWKFLLGLLITIGLMTYLIIDSNPSALLTCFSNMNFLFFLIGLCLSCVLYLIKILRWQYILSIIDLKISFQKACKLILIGTFGSSLTPAKVGDILRAFYLSKNNDEAKIGSTIFSVVFDRLLDLGGILIILLVSFPFLLTKVVFLDLSWWIFLGIVIGFVLFVIIIIFIFNKKFTRKIITFFVKFIARAFKKKSRQNKILIQTDDISNDFFVFQKKFKIRNYFFLTIFSVLFWIVLGFQGVFFLLAFGESTFQPLLISGILAIGALSAIAFPFSISGIGIRDTILRELFSKIMFISIHNALNLSILQTLVNVIFPGLLGGIVLIVRFVRTITRRNRQKTSEKQVPN